MSVVIVRRVRFIGLSAGHVAACGAHAAHKRAKKGSRHARVFAVSKDEAQPNARTVVSGRAKEPREGKGAVCRAGVEEAWDKKLCDKEAKMGKGAPLDLCHMRERGLDGVNGPQNRAQVVHGP